MKKLVLLVAVLALSAACTDNTEPLKAEEDLSTPEQLEKDLKDISKKDWKGLADTLAFFYTEFISKGATSGIGSDGIYYSLIKEDNITLFCVEDSVFVFVERGTDYAYIRACDTDFSVKIKESQGIAVTIEDIRLETESISQQYIEVYYHNIDCGYIVWEHFENTDYTEGYYPVMYYYGDSRTFSFYENIYLFELWDLIGKIQ